MMDPTHFLVELGDEKREELLKKLEIPEKPSVCNYRWVNFIWSEKSLRVEERVYNMFLSSGHVDKTWELNDFMTFTGRGDFDKPHLKILCDFMVENFGDEYRKAAKQYLEELRKTKHAEVEAKIAPEKDSVNGEFDMRVGLLKEKK